MLKGLLGEGQRIVGIEMLPDSAVGSGCSSVIHADMQYAKMPQDFSIYKHKCRNLNCSTAV